MTLDEAITDLKQKVQTVSPSAIIRVMKMSDEEASIRAYAPASDEEAIKEATRDYTFEIFTRDGLDVQVLFYDVAENLPPTENAE